MTTATAKACTAIGLLGVLLAGCLSGGDGDDLLGEDALLDLAFGPPVLVGPQGDVETTLLVGPDGVVLVCSHGGFYQPSPLWVSTDGGATFVRNDPAPNPVPSGDCDLAITESGRWAMVFDTIASATVAASSDQGASWSMQFATALPIAVDRPWIAAAGDTLYMTYSNVMAAEPALQMFARSDDGGTVWTGHTPINVAEPPDKVQAVIGKMLVSDGGDTIHVPLARSNIQLGGAVYLDLAVSRDAGATWDMENVWGPYEPGGLLLPTATWAGDVLYYTVPVANGSLVDIQVLWNEGDGWMGPTPVARSVAFPGVVGPWIDGRPDGSATLAWVGEVDDGWTVSAVRVDRDRAGEVVMLAEPTDRNQGIGHEFIMVDHDESGRAYVAWPMNTEPSCDPAPNPAESRGSQCVFLAIEDAS